MKAILIAAFVAGFLGSLISGVFSYNLGSSGKAATEERLSTWRTAAEQAVAVAASNQAVAEHALQRLSECVHLREAADKRGEDLLAEVRRRDQQRAVDLAERDAQRAALYASDPDADAFRRIAVPESIAVTLRERPR